MRPSRTLSRLALAVLVSCAAAGGAPAHRFSTCVTPARMRSALAISGDTA
jgi:hypothetical protein